MKYPLAKKLQHVLQDKHAKLPKDARTLLRIPRDITISKKWGVEYCYFGIQKGIEGNCYRIDMNIAIF